MILKKQKKTFLSFSSSFDPCSLCLRYVIVPGFPASIVHNILTEVNAQYPAQVGWDSHPMTLPFFSNPGLFIPGFFFSTLLSLKSDSTAAHELGKKVCSAFDRVCIYTSIWYLSWWGGMAEWLECVFVSAKKNTKGEMYTHTVSKERERKIWWESVKHRQTESKGERKKDENDWRESCGFAETIRRAPGKEMEKTNHRCYTHILRRIFK